MATSNNLFISVSPIVQKLILTSGMKLSAQMSVESISSRLCATAESLYLARNYTSLAQVVDVLSGLPNESAQAAGLYYRAMCERRQGRDETAARLLEGVLSNSQYRARALQALGLIHRFAGEYGQAARLYRAAAMSTDLATFINATINLSEFPSLEGDHTRTLNQLRAIQPAVELAAKINPFYAGLYCNEVAFELSQAGRIEEARSFAAFAVSSPYARAYPEWLETAQEIEQARERVAAHKSILRVVVVPTKARALPRTPRILFLIQKLALKASRRRLQPRTAIFTRELPRIRPTLEQVSLIIKIRAPSF